MIEPELPEAEPIERGQMKGIASGAEVTARLDLTYPPRDFP